jgi:predicted GNAT family acetyltransferase
MSEDFTNNTLKNRFELALNGFIAFAEYHLEGSTLYIDRVVAPPELRGTGAAGKLMQNIIDFAQKEKLEIVPICPYAASWMVKNKLIEESALPRFQVRIFLKKEFAEAVMRHETPKEMQPLLDILAKYDAAIDHNQLQEFTQFVADAEAGRKTKIPADQVAGVLALTKNSLANPEKHSYFAREFTLSVGGKDLLQGTAAEALIADLKALGDGSILTHGKAFIHGGSRDVDAVRKSYLPRVHPL